MLALAIRTRARTGPEALRVRGDPVLRGEGRALGPGLPHAAPPEVARGGFAAGEVSGQQGSGCPLFR